MKDKFVVVSRGSMKKEEKAITLSIRIDKEIRDEFDKLAARSDRSRNELIGLALRYALDNLEFVADEEEEEKK